MATIRDTFTTPYDQHRDREGQPFTVLRKIEQADDEHDAEVLPMYRIKFDDDGFETDAWPEEVEGAPDHKEPTPEIAARLEYLRGEIQAERISYGEVAELEGLAEYVDPEDHELVLWAWTPQQRGEV